MNRKRKFITTLISSIVLISMLLVGVYSTISRGVSISGHITFVGVQVSADVVVKATPLAPASADFVAADYKQITDGTHEFRIGGEQEGKNFNLGEIAFTDYLVKYSFSIEITNRMLGNQLLQVEYKNDAGDLPVSVNRTESLTIKDVSQTITGTWTDIGVGETAAWTVVFEMVDIYISNFVLENYINESFTIKRM